MYEFIICSAIQGYHEYKDIWENPIIGEELRCQREIGNSHDTLAVAVMKLIDGHSTIVGHVPRKISASCNAFIRRGGIIQCTVIGSRRYNVDLVQGGVEIPCRLRFIISSQEFCENTEISVCAALSDTNTFSSVKPTSVIEEPIVTESKISDAADKAATFSAENSASIVDDKSEEEPIVADIEMDTVSNGQSESKSQLLLSPPLMETCSIAFCNDNQNSNKCAVEDSIAVKDVVYSPSKKRMKKFNEEAIIMGEKLTDTEINLAQRIIKAQFPNLNGLRSTLLQQKPCTAAGQINENKIQIIFCNDRKHWILATTVGCENADEVKVYDSVFSSLDKDSLRTVMNLFSSGSNRPRVRLSPSQKQKGSDDCGIFAISLAVAIAFGLHPSKLCFRQDRMRAHLVSCLNRESFSLFPMSG